ncbi:MAG: hypothetical protein P4L55_03800 [Syntrophobacteraceae bacterium]|nr:hypothetical protein [Syntrophobacteraceae bacterium]
MVRKILFVCVRNRVRSPFSEFLFKKMLKEKGKGLEHQVEVSSAGFQPSKLRDLLVDRKVEPPKPFYGASMSEAAREELRKRGIAPPVEWTSKELAADDVSNAELILVALSEQKEELLALFPEAHGRLYTVREITGGEPLSHENFSILPFDKTFWWFCEENPDYVGKILSEMEEALIIGFPRILDYLGV